MSPAISCPSTTTTTTTSATAASSKAMSRSCSNEGSKPGKRKGTRSVSTLTPSQLARKRANDREAQRAIRQRTKEHIERLENEVRDLKSQKTGPALVQHLLARNRQLEDELRALKESLGYPPSQSFQSSAVFDETLASGMSGAVASPRTSPYSNNTNFDGITEFPPTNPFMTMDPGAPLYVTGSTASSPASSANHDDFAAYIPATMAPSMASVNIAGQQAAAQMQFKSEFDDGETEPMYGNASHQQYRQQHSQSQPQNWQYAPAYFNTQSSVQSPA